jgi:hypothetical protein
MATGSPSKGKATRKVSTKARAASLSTSSNPSQEMERLAKASYIAIRVAANAAFRGTDAFWAIAGGATFDPLDPSYPAGILYASLVGWATAYAAAYDFVPVAVEEAYNQFLSGPIP